MERAQVKPVIKVFLSHTLRYSWLFFVTLFFATGVQVIEVITPLYYKRFFDAFSIDTTPELLAGVLVGTLLIILFFKIATWIMWRVATYTELILVAKVMTDLVETGSRYLLGHSYGFFTGHFTGSLVRKVTRFPRAYEQVLDALIFQLIPLIVGTGGIIIVLFYRSAALGLGLLAWMAIFVLLHFFIVRWKQKYNIQKAEKDSEVTGKLSDAVSNELNVKLFSGRAHEQSILSRILGQLEKLRLFTWTIDWWIDLVQAALMIAIEFALMYGAIELWREGQLTLGDFALIQSYLISVFERTWSFGRLLRTMYDSFADATEMVEILHEAHEVQDLPHAESLVVDRGTVEFKDVDFSFRKTRTILKNFSLTILPGEKIALVGPSGAGKSTVVKLLFRLYDIDDGKILIDGLNIKDVTQDSLRENISLVPQEPILFHRTLMENIRYGKRDATDRDVIEAARKAHCHEFISEFPEGYETYVGERGVKLSGGERQRVAIARAILKDAPILVLDEATSSLDSESESLIQDALETLMKGKTVIVIAHRLSTIQKMDRIVVIEEGKVSTTGTHAELLEKPGLYQKLWAIQAGGFLAEEEGRVEPFDEDL